MRKLKRSLFLLLCFALLLSCAAAYADFGADADEWTVTLDYSDGSSRNGTLYVPRGESVELPITAVRKGYSFTRWLTAEGEEAPNPFTPDADVTLTAVWDVGRVTVTLLDSDGGAALGTAEVTYGTAPTGLDEPKKDGFAFRYWSLSPNGERINPEEYVVKNDLTLYAVWLEESAKEFVVTFKASDYSAEHSKDKVLYIAEGGQVKKNEAIKSLNREGYKFEGWTSETPPEGNEWTINEFPAKKTPKEVKFPLKPKADTDLYAVWTIQQYMAIFNANYTDSAYKNGVVYSYKLLSNEAVVPPAEIPERPDYSFEGWYTKAIGGEEVDFSTDIRLQSNTGYYAHWKHNGVQTDTFHAEYTFFNPDQKYFGYSGSVQGAMCIVKDAGTVGTVLKDEYPANSKLPAGNGYYVSYQYERGDTLRFVINADKAASARLMANLAVEVDSLDVASTGDNATAIRVNGQDIPYNLTLLRIFQEVEIGQIELQEGENVIEIVVDNDNTVMGGTYRAVGFMTDYIRLADSDASFTWSPIYDNLESN